MSLSFPFFLLFLPGYRLRAIPCDEKFSFLILRNMSSSKLSLILPRSSLLIQLIRVLSAWNLFEISSLNLLLWWLYPSRVRCYTVDLVWGLTSQTSWVSASDDRLPGGWWSEAVSVPLLTRVPCNDLLNLLQMMICSIWFYVWWSGEIHVALCIRLCWKKLPPITVLLLNEQFSAKTLPFSFICSSPSLPITCSLPTFFLFLH